MNFFKRPSIKIISGLLVGVSAIGLTLFYDQFLRVRIDSTEVVVIKPSSEILKNEPITEDKLLIERRPKQTLMNDVILPAEVDEIIGLDANQIIQGNSLLTKTMIDYDELLPNEEEGEAIRPITKEMIYAMPGSLRRKDTVNIYLIYNDGTTNLNKNGPSTTSSEDTKEQIEKISNSMESEPFLKSIKVVYVKDSSNKEVISSSENNKEDKRLNATSSISDLEIILNEEDFKKLMNEVLGKGAKLYITYQ